MIVTAAAMKTQTFSGMPVRTLTTEPEAMICEDVRQKSASTFNTAVKVPDTAPNRRVTTSGIVSDIVLRIFGAKYANGIIATDAASTYQIALIPQAPKALAATPVVDPPPMLFAESENATMNRPIRLPATI